MERPAAVLGRIGRDPVSAHTSRPRSLMTDRVQPALSGCRQYGMSR